jgi:hypothetical protein
MVSSCDFPLFFHPNESIQWSKWGQVVFIV